MLYTSTVYMLIYSVTKNCNYKHTDFYNICAIFVRQATFLCTCTGCVSKLPGQVYCSAPQ